MSFEKELAKVKPDRDTLFTVGVFDGIHLGHQYLFKTLRERARDQGLLSGVITFKSHPQTVLDPNYRLEWINDLPSRLRIIKELGIDIVLPVDFDRHLMQTEARDFIEMMKKHLRLKGLVVGPDFALGKERSGNLERLRNMGKEIGFGVEVMPPFFVDGEVVRSSGIRRILFHGNVKKAARQLGRNFILNGDVIPGERRGRELGFPTLNQDVKADTASPGNGVYATRVHLQNGTLPAVTFIGTRPTFGGIKRLVETHVFDQPGPFKDKHIEVEFIDRVREEEKFENPEELKAAIRSDIVRAKEILNKDNA